MSRSPSPRRARGKWGGRRVQGLTAACLAAYGTVCHLCHQDGATTADHVIPRSKGGTDAIGNLRPAHQACNSARGDLWLWEWFARHPQYAARRRPLLPPSRRWVQA